MASKILILEHRIDKDISDALLNAAVNCIAQHNVECDVIDVPTLEDLPAVVRYNIRSMELRVNQTRYMGYVLLGRVPFTNEKQSSYSLNEIYRDIENLKLQFSIALGIGIVDAPSHEEAMKNAASLGWNSAVNCFKLLSIKKGLGL